VKRAHTIMVETEETPTITSDGNGGVSIAAGVESVELSPDEARAIFLIVRNDIERGISAAPVVAAFSESSD
jgi:hypothetical protein